MGRALADRFRTLTAGVAAEPGIFVMAAALGVVYSVYAVLRHNHFHSGLDLTIFDQAVWHLSRLEEPASTMKGVSNLWGDHFHPILVLLAPLYWVWSDPRTLLIAQALAIAASMVPVFLFARSRIGRPGAYLLAAAYGGFWGFQNGVAFDFHEVAFAPLFIGLAILFADRRRWGPYFVAIGLLLLVKEDLSLLVCFFGLWLLTLREIRWGLVTLVVGLVWYELATAVMIPALSPTGKYGYWSYGQLGKDLPHTLWTIVSSPWRPFEIAFNSSEKATTLLYLVLPFLGLTLCSRVAILAIPLVAERFLSTTQAFWGTSFHYSMAIAPVLAMGAAAGLANVTAFLASTRLRTVAATGAAAVMLGLGVWVTGQTMGDHPQSDFLKASFRHAPPYAGALHRALAHVPSGASVATEDFLGPHLAHRQGIYHLAPGIGGTRYIVAGLVFPVAAAGPNLTYHIVQQVLTSQARSYDAVFLEDGWIVLRRKTPGTSAPAPPAVLTPMSRSASKRLIDRAIPWGRALVRYTSELPSCWVLRQRGDAKASRCFAGAGADFRSRQAALATELRRLAAELHGGCLELANLALTFDDRLSSDLEHARRTGASGSRPAFALALSAPLQRDVADLDYTGKLANLFVLCAPK